VKKTPKNQNEKPPKPNKKSKHTGSFTARIPCTYYTSTYQYIQYVPSDLPFCFSIWLKVMTFHTCPVFAYSEIQLDLTYQLSDKKESR